jgi:hypothetical protein
MLEFKLKLVSKYISYEDYCVLRYGVDNFSLSLPTFR